jgi:methylenetetrahydrofolate dehydrogenase (NADP+) / methenyltetrahydrofolate cyclohydrolase
MPPHISKDRVVKLISSLKDADCLKLQSSELFHNSPILPCTPAACLQVLKENNINLTEKHVVIVGRGRLVGEPLEALLS